MKYASWRKRAEYDIEPSFQQYSDIERQKENESQVGSELSHQEEEKSRMSSILQKKVSFSSMVVEMSGDPDNNESITDNEAYEEARGEWKQHYYIFLAHKIAVTNKRNNIN